MKISKKIQRRTIIFATAAALLALFQILHLGVQLFYSTNPYAGTYAHTFIGQLSTSFTAMDISDGYDEFAYTIERDAEGQPLVEALPSSMLIFSKKDISSLSFSMSFVYPSTEVVQMSWS